MTFLEKYSCANYTELYKLGVLGKLDYDDHQALRAKTMGQCDLVGAMMILADRLETLIQSKQRPTRVPYSARVV